MNNRDAAGAKDGAPPDAPDADLEKTDRMSPVVGNASGRVRFDDRGNAVWEWAVGTGAFGVETSSKRIQKLVNPLSIADDSERAAERPAHEFVASPAPRSAAEDRALAAGPIKANRKGVAQGYSPYDSGLLVKSAAPRPQKKDLRRLGEWLKLRERNNRNKQGD